VNSVAVLVGRRRKKKNRSTPTTLR